MAKTVKIHYIRKDGKEFENFDLRQFRDKAKATN